MQNLRKRLFATHSITNSLSIACLAFGKCSRGKCALTPPEWNMTFYFANKICFLTREIHRTVN